MGGGVRDPPLLITHNTLDATWQTLLTPPSLMTRCRYRFNVVGLPYGGLAGGVLSGKYTSSKYADPDRPLADCRMRARPDFQPRYGMPMAMLATDKYVKLAEEYGVTPTELALAWSKQRPCNHHGAIIIGSTTTRQVEECINAFKLELPIELMDAVDAIHEEFRNPSMFYCDKAVCMKGGFSGGDAWHASNPRPILGGLLKSPSLRTAAAAAVGALAAYAMAKRGF